METLLKSIEATFNDEIFIKLAIATFIGMIIGLERQLKGKPLGLKTSIVMSIVSCLLTIVSIEAAEIFSEAYSKPMDPLRLAAQVVSGVGFIGAGVILRRNNDVISGLTTAAMIWGASGLGIAVGAGFYTEALITFVLMIISVEVLPVVLKYIGPSKLREKEIRLKLVIENNDTDRNLTKILKEIKSKEIDIKNVKVEDILNTNHQSMDLKIAVDEKRYTTDVYYDVKEIENIVSIKVERL